jgi:hypothetical protein
MTKSLLLGIFLLSPFHVHAEVLQEHGQQFQNIIDYLNINSEDDEKLSSLCPETHLGCAQHIETTILPVQNSLSFSWGEENIEYIVHDNQAIFEGDILLGNFIPPDFEADEEIGILSAAKINKSTLWPNGIIPYSIGNIKNPERVQEAIAHWESITKLRFKSRNNESNYINFSSGQGCSSNIGMQGGRQFVYLSSSCTVGNIIHEIGHAVGLWHEQTRSDRSRYVDINWENILPGKESNFKTFSSGSSNRNLGNYDYESIMHYGSYSFSRNGKPTISRWDGERISGQRRGLSKGDLEGIHKLYFQSAVH